MAGRKRPNHFLAIRLTEPALLGRLWEAQQQLMEAQPSLRASLVPLREAHITLNVFHAEADLKFLQIAGNISMLMAFFKMNISIISLEDT